MEPLAIQRMVLPDLNVMRFESKRILNPGKPKAFYTAEDAYGDPWGEKFFDIEGVSGLIVVNTFCDVQKADSISWEKLSPDVESAMRELWG